MSSTNSREAGFTLVELVVVLALVGLLAGLTLPLVHSRGPDPLDEAARSLGRTLESRRLEAMREGRAVAVPLEEVRAELSGEIVLDAAGDSPGRLVFRPHGGSSGGRWTLSHGGRSRIVEVDWLTGRVRAYAAE